MHVWRNLYFLRIVLVPSEKKYLESVQRRTMLRNTIFYILMFATVGMVCYYSLAFGGVKIQDIIRPYREASGARHLITRGCPNLHEPRNIIDEEKFVELIDNYLYLYSAFNDVIHQPPRVILVALRRINMTHPTLYCHLWYDNATSPMKAVRDNKRDWRQIFKRG